MLVEDLVELFADRDATDAGSAFWVLGAFVLIPALADVERPPAALRDQLNVLDPGPGELAGAQPGRQAGPEVVPPRTFGGRTVISGHAPDKQNRAVDPERSERFRELAKRSHAARRAKKARKKDESPGNQLQEAMRRFIENDPDAAVTALMRTARGVDAILQHGAGLFPEAKQERTLIVVRSAFAAALPSDEKASHWLELLRAHDLELLEAELEVHADSGPEAA